MSWPDGHENVERLFRVALFLTPQHLRKAVDLAVAGRRLSGLQRRELAVVIEGVVWILVIKSGVVALAGGVAVAVVGASEAGSLSDVASAAILSLICRIPSYAIVLALIRSLLMRGASRERLVIDRPRILRLIAMAPYWATAPAVAIGVFLG